MKRWPTGTALAAKDSLPMSESSSRFVALRLVLHLSSSCVSSARESGGKQISCFTESRMRPRNDMAVRGPSTFSMATGIPSFEATWRNVSRLRWQQKDCGGGWGWQPGKNRRGSR